MITVLALKTDLFVTSLPFIELHILYILHIAGIRSYWKSPTFSQIIMAFFMKYEQITKFCRRWLHPQPQSG